MGTQLDKKRREYDLNLQLGSQLGRLREAAGLTQDEVAAQLGVGRTAITKIENGNRKLTAVELFDYIRAIHLSPGVFAEDFVRSILEYDSSRRRP